jgi:hypothetical protein
MERVEMQHNESINRKILDSKDGEGLSGCLAVSGEDGGEEEEGRLGDVHVCHN